jgi:hypothetical protein
LTPATPARSRPRIGGMIASGLEPPIRSRVRPQAQTAVLSVSAAVTTAGSIADATRPEALPHQPRGANLGGGDTRGRRCRTQTGPTMASRGAPHEGFLSWTAPSDCGAGARGGPAGPVQRDQVEGRRGARIELEVVDSTRHGLAVRAQRDGIRPMGTTTCGRLHVAQVRPVWGPGAGGGTRCAGWCWWECSHCRSRWLRAWVRLDWRTDVARGRNWWGLSN